MEAVDAKTSTERESRPRVPTRRLLLSSGSIVVLVCVVVVIGVYWRSAESYDKTLSPSGNAGFHDLIADQILAGQTSLTIEPPRGLLELEDPYDPIANLDYRVRGLHDLSLYHGKLYAPYGPAPALLAFIPYRVLDVGNLSPTLAILLFGSVGFLFAYLLFRILVARVCGAVALWVHVAVVLALGLGTPVAWTIYIGRVYEVSLACGYMLLFGGLYFLARGVLVQGEWWALAVGSAALGLAAAARANLAIAAFFVAVAVVLVARGRDRPDRARALVALVLPYSVIGLLLGLYNYARFDSLFEIGQSYQLSGFNARKYPFGRWSYVPRDLYYYLFSPPRFSGEYPYLYLRAITATGTRPGGDYPVAGAFSSMPVTWVGLVLGVIGSALADLQRRRRALLTIGGLVAPAFAIAVNLSYIFPSTIFRYELDFVPLLVLASCLGFALWTRSTPRHRVIYWLGIVWWLAAVAASVVFNLAITFTPCAGTGSC